MSKSDQWVSIVITAFLLIHVASWIAGFVMHKLSFSIALLNSAAGLLIILYWAIKQLSIDQHTVELREVLVFCLEAAAIGAATYSLVTKQWTTWLNIIQYIVFAIHLSALVLFLIFILTFKMKRLF